MAEVTIRTSLNRSFIATEYTVTISVRHAVAMRRTKPQTWTLRRRLGDDPLSKVDNDIIAGLLGLKPG